MVRIFPSNVQFWGIRLWQVIRDIYLDRIQQVDIYNHIWDIDFRIGKLFGARQKRHSNCSIKGCVAEVEQP